MTADDAARAAGSHADHPDGWFFIVGCQRSGTTLMRLVLECHSEVQCCDESSSYNVLRGVASPARLRPRLGLKVPCITEQLASPSWWDYYLIREGLRNRYCGQPIVFMVRNVADTVSSMSDLRIEGEPWNGAAWTEGYLIPALRGKIVNEARFRQRYGAEITKLRDCKHPGLARAAFYWRYKCDALVDYLQLKYPVLVVRYEDLVAHPRLELLRVCGFLQIPWEEGLLHHASAQHTDLRDDGRTIGGTDPTRPIDSASVDRSCSEFDEEQLTEILSMAGEMQPALYPLPVGLPQLQSIVARP